MSNSVSYLEINSNLMFLSKMFTNSTLFVLYFVYNWCGCNACEENIFPKRKSPKLYIRFLEHLKISSSFAFFACIQFVECQCLIFATKKKVSQCVTFSFIRNQINDTCTNKYTNQFVYFSISFKHWHSNRKYPICACHLVWQCLQWCETCGSTYWILRSRVIILRQLSNVTIFKYNVLITLITSPRQNDQCSFGQVNYYDIYEYNAYT